MASFWGSPGTTNIVQTRGTASMRPPGFAFAQWLASQLPGLMNTPPPTYQGSLDPGMSPTLADAIRRAQGYAQSSPPEMLAGVQGALGRFMNPNYINPWNSLYRGGARYGQPMGGGGYYGGAAGGANAGSLTGFNASAPGASPTASSSATNPWNAGAPEMFGGANNYWQVDPNQRVYGGGRAGSMTYQPFDVGSSPGSMPTRTFPQPQPAVPQPDGYTLWW